MAQGVALPLGGDRGTLYLAPAADAHTVRIELECVRKQSDDLATLMPAQAHPIASPAGSAGSSAGSRATESAANATIVPTRPATTDENSTIVPGGSGVLAWLEVRYPGGKKQRQAIHRTPFVIGREPKQSNALVVEDPCCHVSRQHLILEKFEAGAFRTENIGHNQSGTWRPGGDAVGPRFVWRPESAGTRRSGVASDDTGWLCLAGQGDAAAVQLRLVTE